MGATEKSLTTALSAVSVPARGDTNALRNDTDGRFGVCWLGASALASRPTSEESAIAPSIKEFPAYRLCCAPSDPDGLGVPDASVVDPELSGTFSSMARSMVSLMLPLSPPHPLRRTIEEINDASSFRFGRVFNVLLRKFLSIQYLLGQETKQARCKHCATGCHSISMLGAIWKTSCFHHKSDPFNVGNEYGSATGSKHLARLIPIERRNIEDWLILLAFRTQTIVASALDRILIFLKTWVLIVIASKTRWSTGNLEQRRD